MKFWKFRVLVGVIFILFFVIAFSGNSANVGDLIYSTGSEEQVNRILIGNTFNVDIYNPTGKVFRDVTFFVDFNCVEGGRIDNERSIIVTDIDKRTFTRLITINVDSGKYDIRHKKVAPLPKNMNAGSMCVINMWPNDDEISYMIESWIWFPVNVEDSP
ncbi:MAG: hypothetical protein V3U02_06900 [Calditrichia bacterium]